MESLETQMKKYLDDNSFVEKLLYERRIMFLNARNVTASINDDKVKSAFYRFVKLYTHLIIKLIVIECGEG